MAKYKDETERRECSFVVKELSRLTNLPAFRCYAILRRKDKYGLSLMNKYNYINMVNALNKLNYPQNLGYCLGTIKKECEKTGGIKMCKKIKILIDNFLID